MAGSAQVAPYIVSNSSAKEVQANNMLAGSSPSWAYAYDSSRAASLTWAWMSATLPNGTDVAQGQVTLTASTTNYIEANPTTGAVTVNTTGFASSGTYKLYQVVTSATAVTSYLDRRATWMTGGGGGGTWGTLTVNPQSGTTYTLVLADQNAIVEQTNAAAITTTIPTTASVALPIGSVVLLRQAGAGSVTASPASGVTFSSGSVLTTSGIGSYLELIKTATNTWDSVLTSNAPNSGAFKNLLINADGRINQRGYASATATTAANQYTVDRWKVNTSGQNLTFTVSGNITTFTAPAGGLTQIIEASNILGGIYCASWVGAGTLTVNGTAVANGASFTLPANTNATITFIGQFATPQIEIGTIPTPFEFLPVDVQRARCRWYYQTGLGRQIGYSGTASNAVSAPVQWDMRASPSVTFNITSSSNVNTGASSLQSLGAGGGNTFIISTASGNTDASFTFTLSAEL